MLTDRIDQKVTQGQKHRSLAAHVTSITRTRKILRKAKKSNWGAMAIRAHKVLKYGPRVCVEGIRRKDVLDGCGLSRKESFIERKLCNRLYVMVGSRLLDTWHPVHTEDQAM